MKYKVGDKVRYDGGDWWFYGTVSAVFEHSICPCYRLNVERMEKKNCKFSITQFEFELEADNEVENGKDKRKWENSEIEDLKKYYGVLNHEDLSKILKRSPQAIEEMWQQIKPGQKLETVPEPEKIQKQKQEPTPEKIQKQEGELKQEVGTEKSKEIRLRKTTDAWEKNFEMYRNGEKSNVLNAWKSKNRKDFQIGILAKDKYEKLMEINFSFDPDKRYKPTTRRKEKENVETPQTPQKRKRGKAWDENLEAYRNGEKSNAISTWMTENRKQYRTGVLPEDKFEKLMEINFPFEIVRSRKLDSWDRQLEEWKKGDRKSDKIQLWKQRSIRRFLEGKLSADRMEKLKEVGILK